MRRRPRSLGLQATALPGAAARGRRRLRGRRAAAAAAYGDDGSGAVGEDDRGRWTVMKGDFLTRKVVTEEVTVQGVSQG